jgi:hypothetical protein
MAFIIIEKLMNCVVLLCKRKRNVIIIRASAATAAQQPMRLSLLSYSLALAVSSQLDHQISCQLISLEL